MSIQQIQHLRLADYPRMPWRNGGGVTTEVACQGSGLQHFDWRLSIADVGQDGPFSVFSGMQRIIAVLEGTGIEMTVDGQTQAPLTLQQPYAFSGNSAVQCRLLDGPIRDFNLIYSPQRYRARLQWLQGTDSQTFYSCAETVLVFNAGQALQIAVDGASHAAMLAHHDCLRVETDAALTEYCLAATRGEGVNACVIELQAIAPDAARKA